MKKGEEKTKSIETVLHTERLVLRRFTEDDAEAVYALAKDPTVGPPAGWKPHESVEESLEVLRTIFLPSDSFAVTEAETGRLAGAIELAPDRYRPDANSNELGYWLGTPFQGRGLMTEAAEAVITYGFLQKGLAQIGICTDPVNRRSRRVISKCGFIFEGRIRRTYKIYDGSLRDSLLFSLLREEWEERHRSLISVRPFL